MAKQNTLCGMFNWYPQFLQRFANTRSFIAVYGLLGIFQAMGYIYLVITLPTIEKRFKIPSQTTGLILSGNEISQILLSVILAYIGGKSNRPRFISIGVVFCSISCFILAMPHFLYGAGDDALKLTKEYMESSNVTLDDSEKIKMERRSNRLCIDEPSDQQCDDEIKTMLPLILIFLSQFVLGVGNTLFYALGQTYLDDGVTKKKNTPILLAYAFSLRTFGPAVGFVIGYACLKIYIDPTKTPLIDSTDPRWMGAYWLGWVFIGIALMIVAVLIGLFPKELPKKPSKDEERLRDSDETPKMMKSKEDAFYEDSLPLRHNQPHAEQYFGSINDFRSLTDIPPIETLPSTLIRLFKNKLLMYNTLSGIFYILGASAYFTYMSKYLEVQFHKSAADATIITGPFTLIGMVMGFLVSGIVITKAKPSTSKILMWNVIVGIMFMVGELVYLFLTCPDGQIPLNIVNRRLNLTSECNNDCYCSGIPYTPVCLEETGDTFFSPCVASCRMYSKQRKAYYQCDCAKYHLSSLSTSTTKPFFLSNHTVDQYEVSNIISNFSAAFKPTTESISNDLPASTLGLLKNNLGVTNGNEDVAYDDDSYSTTINNDYSESSLNDRARRSIKDKETEEDQFWGKMTPGACVKGCAFGFYAFSLISSIINCFGTSGRIGNILLNFRCVSIKDKSVTQGLILMLVSLFALIPGPILYGRIIDETCIVWTEQCNGRKGNCQLYDQKLFRYYVNLTAFCLTTIGVFFDVLVWKNGRHLDLYTERTDEEMRQQKKAAKQMNNNLTKK
ncbi:unnamed protein product [Chironomus riparius]|uniref:Solute carrier organic anion transporter family member n=1 Tax=Chironomus riparius TaxID=315576 RepID=A0A9N9RJ61_9DIPT|nr:unnamed protein product [Chironomus riparius]